MIPNHQKSKGYKRCFGGHHDPRPFLGTDEGEHRREPRTPSLAAATWSVRGSPDSAQEVDLLRIEITRRLFGRAAHTNFL
jgi:hypothetical protein